MRVNAKSNNDFYHLDLKYSITYTWPPVDRKRKKSHTNTIFKKMDFTIYLPTIFLYMFRTI